MSTRLSRQGRSETRRKWAVPGLLAASCAASLTLGSALDKVSAVATPFVSAISPPPLLPTSVQTSGGTWADIPMGHLNQRLNTFWQLFFLPRNDSIWRNEVSSLGIATNGGLVLATSTSGSLFVGTRPSNLLRFTALASSANNGRTWSEAAPVPGVEEGLAVGPGNSGLALVGTTGGGTVFVASSGLVTWNKGETAQSLARSPSGHGCNPLVLTAVGFDAIGTKLIGASCSQPGVVGIFAKQKSGWRLAGPLLPSSTRLDSVSVLDIQPSSTGTMALLLLRDRSVTQVVAAWSRTDSARWDLSPIRSLGASARVLSIGRVDNAGQFVYYSVGTHRRLITIGGSGSSWSSLPSVPSSTETVAFGSSGRVDALAVNGTVMTDWTLTGHGNWKKSQVISVDISFGSSN